MISILQVRNRVAPSNSAGGGVATMYQAGSGGGFGGRGCIAEFAGLDAAPKDTPNLDSETSGEAGYHNSQYWR